MVTKYLSSTKTNELRAKTLESSLRVVVMLTCLMSLTIHLCIVSVTLTWFFVTRVIRFLSVKTPIVLPWSFFTGN
jgi:hypothetical protein